MALTQRRILTFAAVIMAGLGVATAAGAAIEHQGIFVGFQLSAAALLYYWGRA